MFLFAFRAFAFDDEGHGVGEEAFGQFKTRNVDVLHAEWALARFAVEVDVSIMMVAFSIFLAKLIVEDASSIFEGMHYIMLQEKC